MMHVRVGTVLAMLAFTLGGTARTVDEPIAGLTNDSGVTAYLLQGWECLESSKCPSGYLLTPSGNFQGCTRGSLGCEGSCYTCAGSNVVISVCYSKPTGTCNVQLGPLTNCGAVRRHPSGCTGFRPSGFPLTPNQCYCLTSYGQITTTDSCVVKPCI
jgi:hypothetical protein